MMLKIWVAPKINVALEYLHNKKGGKLAKQFWEKFIKEDKDR
jgi:hypothetical protein